LSSQQNVATPETILDKESDSRDLRMPMNWHIDCCASQVLLFSAASTDRGK
jgi:hypothetical protein